MEPLFTEKDWKLFRSKISVWQENYMDKLTKEYIKLLSSDIDASEKFWELENRIKNDKRKKGVVCEMRRSEMIYNLISLINEGAITLDDLDGFSEDLKERIAFVTRNN